MTESSTFSRTTWRLVRNVPAPGAWNMAVDEAILEASARSQVPPTLRLYAWEPACLSLGFAQPFADVDSQALRTHGWDVVRRPTGGRAILHTDELTYSVTGPQTEPRLAGSVLESYRVLAQALLAALHSLDIPAEALPRPGLSAGLDPKGPVCFEVPSNYEITVAGKKLIGSAQSRRIAGVLQHGSLPLTGDLRRITQALCFPTESDRQEAASRLLEHAITTEAILGHPLPWETAAEAFARAFAGTLNLDLQHASLTPGELERAEELMATKYSHPSWTERI